MTLINDSGYNTPTVDVHPTSARRTHPITVQSDNTVYTDEHITAKFLNRGSQVTVSDGQYIVTPTVQSYEFRTKTTVGKTG